MNRQYFKAAEINYEAIRLAMDAESGFPSNVATTWFPPAATAPRDPDGNCLISAKPPIAEKFLLSDAIEITEEEYKSYVQFEEILDVN